MSTFFVSSLQFALLSLLQVWFPPDSHPAGAETHCLRWTQLSCDIMLPVSDSATHIVPGHQQVWSTFFLKCACQRTLHPWCMHVTHTSTSQPLQNCSDLLTYKTTPRVTSVAWAPGASSQLVSGHEDGSLRAWDANTGQCLRSHRKKGPEVTAAIVVDR